ncbi:hypothetical protein D9758_016010 [Tetrapyrgos nigripes]|uniref:Uncharacterized protein n=1 Tax=Tetrapyrgos nigripes TaxID=182062 RepID=A0A8H5CLN8_9AGAR|nr:hypothetical protein D9758_016010 [Tetrapyrgos nigripes]
MGQILMQREGIMDLHCKQQQEWDIWIFSSILWRRGQMLMQREEYGFALQAAAYMGKLDIVKYFVEEKGVDVNAKGGKYGSALRAAQEGNKPEVMKYLQQHGATEYD